MVALVVALMSTVAVMASFACASTTDWLALVEG